MTRLGIRRSTWGAAGFAAASGFAAAYFYLVDSGPGAQHASRLAQTGATLGLLAIIAVVLLLLAGIILVVLGRRRSRDIEE